MEELLVHRPTKVRRPLPPTQGNSRQEFELTSLLDELCVMVSHLTQSTTVLVARRDPETRTIKVLGKTGTLITEVDMSFVIPALNEHQCPMLTSQDVRKDARFQNHPLLRLMPHIKSIIVMLIPGGDISSRAVLKVINPKRTAMNDGGLMRVLADLCHIVSHVLNLESEICSVRKVTSARDLVLDSAPRLVAGAGATESTTVDGGADLQAAARFLKETLVRKHRLHLGNGLNCISLRTWRKPIRKYQASALAELQGSPMLDLAAAIAEELADYVRSAHGEQVIRHVAPMSFALPAAESALGNAVAVKVAELLGAELCPGVKFASSSAEGSHSAAGETQQFSESTTRSISGPLLLTDIHFSSVRNWEKAVAASKPAFSPIYGVTWIA